MPFDHRHSTVRTHNILMSQVCTLSLLLSQVMVNSQLVVATTPKDNVSSFDAQSTQSAAPPTCESDASHSSNCSMADISCSDDVATRGVVADKQI